MLSSSFYCCICTGAQARVFCDLLNSDWAFQVEDLIHRTSQTLQLLMEYDPVRQRLDRLRLGTSCNQIGVPAASRMRLSSQADAEIERSDTVDNRTLKRRSLRYNQVSALGLCRFSI